MTKKKFSCELCDAFGTITIQNDSSEFYSITTCPACGAELTTHEDTDEDDE